MYYTLSVANITHYWLPLLLTNYYQYNTLIILHPHYTLLVPYYVYLYSALPVLQISGSVTCFTATPSLHVISSLLCLPILRLTCVTDFGLSNVFYGDTSLSTQCGSPAYAAPEILNNQKYGPAVDIWSM